MVIEGVWWWHGASHPLAPPRPAAKAATHFTSFVTFILKYNSSKYTIFCQQHKYKPSLMKTTYMCILTRVYKINVTTNSARFLSL